MLFWIFVLMFIIGIVWFDRYDDNAVSLLMWVIGILGIAVSLFVIICSYLGLDGQVSANHTRYDTLVYQAENNIYDNDNDLGKRELIVDIQEWNEDLSFYKEAQDDFWIGIYIPNVYDQFEYIPLTLIK